MGDSRLKKKLIKNTAYLYLLTFSSQAIAILTIPFQTRMLTPEMFGVVGFAVSTMTIMSLILGFGFMYSATQLIAERREDLSEVSRIYSAVFAIKLVLGAFLLIVLFFLCFVGSDHFGTFRVDGLLFCCLFSSSASSRFFI